MFIVKCNIGPPLPIELTQKNKHQNCLEKSTCTVILSVPPDGNKYFGINLEVAHWAQPCLIISAISLCNGQVFGLELRYSMSLFGDGNVQITDELSIFSNLVKIIHEQVIVPGWQLLLGVVIFTSGLDMCSSKLWRLDQGARMLNVVKRARIRLRICLQMLVGDEFQGNKVYLTAVSVGGSESLVVLYYWAQMLSGLNLRPHLLLHFLENAFFLEVVFFGDEGPEGVLHVDGVPAPLGDLLAHARRLQAVRGWRGAVQMGADLHRGRLGSLPSCLPPLERLAVVLQNAEGVPLVRAYLKHLPFLKNLLMFGLARLLSSNCLFGELLLLSNLFDSYLAFYIWQLLHTAHGHNLVLLKYSRCINFFLILCLTLHQTYIWSLIGRLCSIKIFPNQHNWLNILISYVVFDRFQIWCLNTLVWSNNNRFLFYSFIVGLFSVWINSCHLLCRYYNGLILFLLQLIFLFGVYLLAIDVCSLLIHFDGNL